MGQPQGRHALKWIAEVAGYTGEVFNAHNSQMCYSAGRRSVAVELFQKLREADEPQFLKIIGEVL